VARRRSRTACGEPEDDCSPPFRESGPG
jgi:hypothetical protein